jgi:hypothetical protein
VIDFEVIFYDWITYETIRSKVYAVTKEEFLIADSEKFRWVPIESCELPIDRAIPIEMDDEIHDSAWDSYERILAASL